MYLRLLPGPIEQVVGLAVRAVSDTDLRVESKELSLECGVDS